MPDASTSSVNIGGDPSGNAGLVGWWARNAGQFTALSVMLILFGFGTFAILYQMDRMYRDAREERVIERLERKVEGEQRRVTDDARVKHMREAEGELRDLNNNVRQLNTTIENLDRKITRPGGGAMFLPPATAPMPRLKSIVLDPSRDDVDGVVTDVRILE
jgi:hypothetical protein